MQKRGSAYVWNIHRVLTAQEMVLLCIAAASNNTDGQRRGKG